MFSNLKSFIDIVESKSITKTAQKHCMNQSTLSAQIRAMEKTAGVHFFDRSGRSISPTANGLLFYEFAKEFMAKYELLEAKMVGTTLPESALMICAGFDFNNYFLPKILQNFEKENPFVEISATTKISDQIIPEIENKEYDLAIIASSHPIRSPNLLTDFAYSVPFIGICSPENPLAKKSAICSEDLVNERIFMTTPTNNLHNYLKHVFQKHRITFAKEINLDSQAGVKNFVKSNMGIAFIAKHVALEELERGELVQFEVEGIKMSRQMYGIHHIERPPTIIMQEFIEETIQAIDNDPYFTKVQG